MNPICRLKQDISYQGSPWLINEQMADPTLLGVLF